MKKIIIIVLMVCLMLFVGYTLFDKYQQKQKQINTFYQGVQYGHNQVIVQLFQQSITCQKVPVTVENQTINLIAVECLSQK